MASNTKKFFGSLAQFGLPIVGGLLGGPPGAAIGGAAGGALSGKKGALGQAALGAGLGYGGAKLLGAGGGGGGIMNMFGGGGGNVAKSSSMSSYFNPMVQGGSTSNIGQGGFGLLKSPMGGDGASLMSMFGNKNLLGLGSLALGLGKQFPEAPQTTPSLEEARSKILSGGSPLGQFASNKLQSQMGQEFSPLDEFEISAALRQLEKDKVRALEGVRETYRNARPGSSMDTDSTFRKDYQEVEQQYSQLAADTVANRTRDVKSQFDQQRTQQIQLALGANESEMNQLMNIAQLDLVSVMKQLDLDAENARLFKETFLNLGASMLKPKSALDEFIAGELAKRKAA